MALECWFQRVDYAAERNTPVIEVHLPPGFQDLETKPAVLRDLILSHDVSLRKEKKSSIEEQRFGVFIGAQFDALACDVDALEEDGGVEIVRFQLGLGGEDAALKKHGFKER
jgi:hypothetical protein